MSHLFLGLLQVSFPQLFVIEADLALAKRVTQKQKVLVLTCFLLASKSPFSVAVEIKMPCHLLKAATQGCSLVGLIYSAALGRALWVWCWGSGAIWSCDDGCVKGLVAARMSCGHTEMH